MYLIKDSHGYVNVDSKDITAQFEHFYSELYNLPQQLVSFEGNQT